MLCPISLFQHNTPYGDLVSPSLLSPSLPDYLPPLHSAPVARVVQCHQNRLSSLCTLTWQLHAGQYLHAENFQSVTLFRWYYQGITESSIGPENIYLHQTK